MPDLTPVDYDPFETRLTPSEESVFQGWKARYAPNDSGHDYDLRGAFKAGVLPAGSEAGINAGHWPDTFKKPNHPTFSVQSQYAPVAPDRAGTWNGDTYVPAQDPFERAAQRVRSSVKPEGGRQEGWLTENPDFGLVVPHSPLDAAVLAAGGPMGRMAKVATLAAGAALTPEDVQAGPISKVISGGGSILDALANAAQKGIRAFHGSPHDFDKFDISKIGTGEGAQAYGHGLYFAENPEVARQYRDNLTHPARGIGYSDSADEALGWLRDASNDKKLAEKLYKENSAKNGEVPDPHVLEFFRTGHMYEVNINAHPDQFLDWENPALISQSPELRDKLLSAGFTGAASDAEYAKGLKRIDRYMNTKDYDLYWRDSEDFRRGMTKFIDAWDAGGDQAAINWLKENPRSPVMRKAIPDRSAAFIDDIATKPGNVDRLRDAGIPGIKYFDQGSRGAGARFDLTHRWNDKTGAYDVVDGSGNVVNSSPTLSGAQRIIREGPKPTSNYVLFDDKLVDIIRKYGIAGLSMMPASTAAFLSTKIKPVDHDPFENQQ